MNKRGVIILFVSILALSSCQFFLPASIDGDRMTFEVKLSDSLILQPDNRLLLKKVNQNAATVLLNDIDSVDLRKSEKYFLSNGKVYVLKSIESDLTRVMDRVKYDIEFETVLNIQ